MTELEKIAPRDRRIVKHVEAINAAGSDIKKFAEAVRGVRDDPGLTTAHRDAIWKTLAQDAAVAYFVFATGKPIDLESWMADAVEGKAR